MGIDLKLANDLFAEAKNWAHREYGTEATTLVNYFSVLAVASALLSKPELAKRFQDEAWLHER